VDDIVPLAGDCFAAGNLGALAGMISPGSTCYNLGLFSADTYAGITGPDFSDGQSFNMLAIGSGTEYDAQKNHGRVHCCSC
jgi:hypothetical protein